MGFDFTPESAAAIADSIPTPSAAGACPAPASLPVSPDTPAATFGGSSNEPDAHNSGAGSVGYSGDRLSASWYYREGVGESVSAMEIINNCNDKQGLYTTHQRGN